MTEESHDQPTTTPTTPGPLSTSVSVQNGGTAAVGNESIAVGEHGVYVGRDAQSPIHTGTGNIIQNITQYIVNPPPLQVIYQDLRRFLSRNRWFLGLVIVLEIPLGVLFSLYKDRFLLSWWAYLATAILLAIVAWSWVNLFYVRSSQASQEKKTPARRPLLVAIILTVAWCGLLSVQVRATLFPRQFSPSQFGIAIATFGEGADFHVTRLGRQVSGLLHNQLDEAITTTPELSDVVLTSIGVVRDAEQGLVDGERVGAKLVICGQILERDEGVIIHFQVLQTPGMTDNPSFPHVIPIVRRPLQTSIDVETADSIKVKQIATRQSLAITAFSLGLYYYFDPNYPHAAEQFEIARAHLESGPGPAGATDLGLVYYYLGKSYQMLGKFEQSQEMLNRAAELNPGDPAAVLGQMYNYRVLGQEELEQQALERAVALCNQLPGDHIAAIYDRAIAYEAMEDDEAALGMLQEAQALAEGDPAKQVWLHLDTGRVYEKIGQTETAIQEYNQSIDLDPTLVTPYFYLASLYDELGETDAAWLNYENIIDIGYNPSWAQELFAGFLYRIGYYEQAIEHYLEALRYPVYDASLLHTHLGLAYASADEEDVPDKEARALAEFEAALQDPGSNEHYICSVYGNVLAQFGHVNEAIVQLERSLELDPEISIETMLNLGQMYEAVGEPEKARALYQQLVELGDQIPADRLHLAQERLDQLEE
ncbi:MAG: tetratricopeptide repeat protein [Chloroflexota bacterium]|nr:tetratricopeptide repeat protein [Chloroflexota bacterium]